MPSASVSTATAVKPGFFSSCRTANLRSFMTQRLHWMDPRGSTRRKKAGYQRDKQKRYRNRDKRTRLGGTDFKQLVAEQPGEPECGKQAKPNSKRNQSHAF